MSETTAALDALHRPGAAPSTPTPGSHADRATAAAVALIAVLRIDPAGQFRSIVIDPDGTLSLHVASFLQATRLANRLGLNAPRYPTELDGGVLCRRWSGLFADHPVVIVHTTEATR